ncbi:MAG: DNA gyrase inhibitor YacG [Mariprofundaceae bacterium]
MSKPGNGRRSGVVVRCPVCQREVARSCAAFPFCSERCRIIDLGRWATGDYRIPGEPAPIPDEDDAG